MTSLTVFSLGTSHSVFRSSIVLGPSGDSSALPTTAHEWIKIPWLRFTSVHTNSSLVNKQTSEPGRKVPSGFPLWAQGAASIPPPPSSAPSKGLGICSWLEKKAGLSRGFPKVNYNLDHKPGGESIWTFPHPAPIEVSPQACGITPPMGTPFLVPMPL